MPNKINQDAPLHEICFDFSAGILDLSEFHALVRSCLRQRMACDDVLIRCPVSELTPLLERLKGVGWFAEVIEGQRLLHAALAQNGRPIGLLSCVRELAGPAWTAAEGAALRRQATTMSSHIRCPPGDAATEDDEGAPP